MNERAEPSSEADAGQRFVSFAQNFEDVMLWRALGHVENGFYVDVGAQDPVLDSVSKAFYDRGWSGIDIEPVPGYAALLREARPRNRVLECALSDRTGREPLFVFGDSGLSTLLSHQAERNHERLGLAFETREVEVRTLRDVLGDVSREIHWLKVDVEGAEDEVLRSWQGSPIHPWIVVVEATRPNEQEPSHGTWEPILVEAGYAFVYFDGLNRFYVAPEHPELRSAFAAPPNVFDRFTLAALDRLDRSFHKAERYAKSLEAEVATQHDAVRAELEAQRTLAARRDAELKEAAVYTASLDAELAARSRHASAFEEELTRALAEIDSQRSVAERRSSELEKAGDYVASLRAELALRTAAFTEAERYALSLKAELATRATAFTELERYALELQAESDARATPNRKPDEPARDFSAPETATAAPEPMRRTRMADERDTATAAALAKEIEACRRWHDLAMEQIADTRRQAHALAGLVGMPDAGPADPASLSDDPASARAAHEETQRCLGRLRAEVERIAIALRDHEQRR